MRRLAAALLLAVSCAGPAPDPAPPAPDPDLISRMEAAARGVDRFAWDVIPEWDSGETAMDLGWKIQGRFRRGEGIRLKGTVMGAAHGMGHGVRPGANLHQIFMRPGRTAVSFSTLHFEAGHERPAPPHLLFRAERGEPDFDAVDPWLLGGPDPGLARYDEPLVALQVAPRLLFDREPGLREDGTVEFHGVRCRVLRSRRTGGGGGPSGWYPPREVVRRFYIEEETALLAGLDVDATLDEGRRTIRSRVVRRLRTAAGLLIPAEVRVTDVRPGLRLEGRRRVIPDPDDG